MAVATDTVTYKQIFDDCDVPVEITWEVNYRVTTAPGDQEIEITGRELVEIRAEVLPGRWLPVATQDCDTAHADVARHWWAKVDRAFVNQACWDHFDNS